MANLRISELDFENIKRNLKDFLKTYRDNDGDVVFTDYEFEGSSLSIMIDLLAYNTHYNAYMSNMIINEMFLDSAVKRESAVSIAKHLGYVPRSTKSARAIVTFDVTNPVGSPPILTLERFTTFSTEIDNVSYTFVNKEPMTIESREGTYTFTDVELFEGVPLEVSYLVINPGPGEKYVIPNENVDLSTLRVVVQKSFTDPTITLYTLADDITQSTPTANVYYAEENALNRYEIFFGDGVLGRKLEADNIVRMQYLISNGANCNVSGTITQTFRTSASIGGGLVQPTIVATQNSTGGADKENIESIKFNAPKFFATYNRAVTSSDYEAIIRKSFPLIESIASWGGEENNPPKYGKIMISLKPFDGYVISNAVKQQILTDVLASKSVMAIQPEFVDPEYIYIGINTQVSYDKNTSTTSEGFIRNAVDTVIRDFFKLNLQQFDQDFLYSQLVTTIDDADPAIMGNVTRLHLQRRITPNVDEQNIYLNENTIKFNNPLIRSTLRTTAFNFVYEDSVVSCKMIDVPRSVTSTVGDLRIVSFDGTRVIQESIGTVNYQTGELSIANFFFAGYSFNVTDIRINAEPANLNINSDKNQVLLLDNSTQNTNVLREAGLRISMVSY
jgi:hypothetical protein